MIHRKYNSYNSIVSVLSVALFVTACATVTPPPQLSPVGKISFYDYRVQQINHELAQYVVDAEAKGFVNADDAKKIKDVCREVAKAGIDLEASLQAGTDIPNAKAKFVKIVSEALQRLPAHLKNLETRKIVQGYVDLIVTLLSFVSI